MPGAVTAAPYRTEPQSPPRKFWTRTECAAIREAGLLAFEELELSEGDLISRMGKNWPHARGAAALLDWLNRALGIGSVASEAPIDVFPEDNPTNEPVPDLIVLARPTREFRNNPQPKDLLLVAEVSDSTLQFDLQTKCALYARAGVNEYWVLDVTGRRLFVHRDPREGRYQAVTVFGEHESVEPLAAPGRSLKVSELF